MESKKDTVIITEPNNISKEDKERLQKSGFIVIEAKDQSKITFLTDVNFISGDILFQSAMSAIQWGNGSADNKIGFYNELMKRLKLSRLLI